MNIENLDSFITELTEEELKSCNGGGVADFVDESVNGVNVVSDNATDGFQRTTNSTIDGSQRTIDGVQKDATIFTDAGKDFLFGN